MTLRTGLLFLAFLAVIAGIFSLGLIWTHNSIVDAGKRVEEAEGQIAAVCQRRLDLVPNLIETVKAYAAHEKEVLTRVTAARAEAEAVLKQVREKGLTPETIEALDASQSLFSGAFRSISALVENYPDLKASANFLALQDQFEGTENRIAVSRERYNTAVRVYNARIEKFPGLLVAPLFLFEKAAFFKAQPEAGAGVKAVF